MGRGGCVDREGHLISILPPKACKIKVKERRHSKRRTGKSSHNARNPVSWGGGKFDMTTAEEKDTARVDGGVQTISYQLLSKRESTV